MKRILVLCTGNSCRSQMAEGYLRHFAGSRAEIYSAGIDPHGVNPRAMEIMLEDGIDITAQTSNHIDEYHDVPFDYVITVCDHARENCPFFPTEATRIHHNFQDPSRTTGSPEKITAHFREVRDAIREYCRIFIETHIT